MVKIISVSDIVDEHGQSFYDPEIDGPGWVSDVDRHWPSESPTLEYVAPPAIQLVPLDVGTKVPVKKGFKKSS